MEPLWQPSPERIDRAQLSAFIRLVNALHTAHVETYEDLHRWSVAEPAKFWLAVWSSGGVIARSQGRPVVRNPHRMPGARWFPDARLNFAENLLRSRDDAPALVFRGEDGARRELSHRELHDRVVRLAGWLRSRGIGAGDRIGGILPNAPEAVIAMLASASVGAVWSSCSPDFGVQGIVDRFGQTLPRILFAVDGYHYGGRVHDTRERVAAVRAAIPSVETVVVVPFVASDPNYSDIEGAVAFDEAAREVSLPFVFEPFPFDHPLAILFSSGTTGPPKCIVHGAGGTLLQHLKEHRLHVDVRPGDRLFYFTTCGWMMWNWLVSGLASGATLVLYDGSPFHPSPSALFDLIDEERIAIFGTSAKFIDGVAKKGLEPGRTHDLSTLRTILSTGSPLSPESFDYVYTRVKSDLCLSSISGGTDIISCFVAGNPIGPVHRGEIQALALGMDVDVVDVDGKSIRGAKGELVCRSPFPSMPNGFWNDPDGSRYRAAYFERFPGVWCHGDFAEITENGGVVIHGRSDAILNPGGVRIGTAEIYRQVESLDEVIESLAVGQEWDGDVRIVLFVQLREGTTLDDELRDRIRDRIRSGASPRHVPARMVQVADIPRTRSGKIVELAVRDVIHGLPIRNRESLANPEALDLYRDLPELSS